MPGRPSAPPESVVPRATSAFTRVSARNRSSRSVAATATVKLSSGSRGGLWFGAAGILPPEGDRQGDRAAAHGDVGDVEGRPAKRTDADVEEIDHAAGAADPVEEVARGAAG